MIRRSSRCECWAAALGAGALLIACACSQPATRSELAPRRATPTARDVRAGVSPIIPTLVRSLKLGIAIGEARTRWPALFTAQGAHDPELDATVRALGGAPISDDAAPFTAVDVELRTPAQRDRMLASWGAPVVGNDGYGKSLRAYVASEARLRARALAAPAPGEQCQPSQGSFTHCTIRIDEHWPLDTHLELLGVRGDASLLHASEADLVRRFGARYRSRGPFDSYVTLPGLGADEYSNAHVTFGEQRVQVVFEALSPTAIEHAEILRRARERFAAAGSGPYGELLFAHNGTQLQVRLDEGRVSSLELRDLARCPSEHLRIAGWMQARTRESPGTVVSLVHRTPFPLVRERATSAHGCTDSFQELAVPGRGCDLGAVETSTIATDCCDRSCAAAPVAWMLRLEEAVLREDLGAIRAMLPPDRPVPVSYESGTDDDTDSRSWTLTRHDTPLEALAVMFGSEYSPQCPPDEHIDEGGSSSSEEIVCLVGEGLVCGALFRWMGDARQLYLESVTFRCC